MFALMSASTHDFLKIQTHLIVCGRGVSHVSKWYK